MLVRLECALRASVAKSAPPDESGELCGESPEESVSEDAASPMSCPGGDSSKVRLTVDRQGLRKFFEEVTTPGKEDKRIQQPHQPRADEVCLDSGQWISMQLMSCFRVPHEKR